MSPKGIIATLLSGLTLMAFMPTLWTNMGATTAAPRPIERTEQRWFVGAHANVGGGCFSDPLAQLPLKWLEGKAAALGLGFNDEFATDQDAAMGRISDRHAALGGIGRPGYGQQL